MFKDLTGQRFGKLLVVSRDSANDKWGNAVWICQCDCGNVVLKVAGNLQTGHSKSCGCLTKFPPGLGAKRRVLSTYRQSAKARNIPFLLTDEEFLTLTQQNCFYCGAPPTRSVLAAHPTFNGTFIYNGIDRIDNSRRIGYTKENSVPCCLTCNKAKNAQSKEEFLAWVKQVYEHSVEQRGV